ncbi:MAG: hypothetical protein OEY14_10105 [Myxococcales bacterium]|nr:hypothetical protein [Myxococcales bacterium]
MMTFLDDRRSRRSTNPQTALRYQLERTREQASLEALVVADADGFVVAGAGDSSICQELGAFAPLLFRCVMGMRLPPLLRGGNVAVRPMRANGAELYVATIGGGVARDALLQHSMHGVQRILASN